MELITMSVVATYDRNSNMLTIRFLAICLVLIAGIQTLAVAGDRQDFVEIERSRSPDGRVEAIVKSGSIDATTPNVVELYIVQSGADVKDENLVLVGDHFQDVTISWRRDRFLDITYLEGRIFRYQNFWQSKAVDEYSYVVEIRLIPPTDTFSLSDRDRWQELR